MGKDLGPHVSGDEEAKIIERMRTRLRRARTTGLKRYAYTTPQGIEAWCWPMEDVAAAQAKETIDEINELFSKADMPGEIFQK